MKKTKVDIEKLKQDEYYFKLEVLSRLALLYNEVSKDIKGAEESIAHNIKQQRYAPNDTEGNAEAIAAAEAALETIYEKLRPFMQFLKVPDVRTLEKLNLSHVIHNQCLWLASRYGYQGMPIAFSEFFDEKISELYAPKAKEQTASKNKYDGLKVDFVFIQRIRIIDNQIKEAADSIDRLKEEIEFDEVAIENACFTEKAEYQSDKTSHTMELHRYEDDVLMLTQVKQNFLRPKRQRFVMNPEFYARQNKKQK